MPRPEQLPLELLQTFVAIADLDGDASKAAERLGISQPSISKRITSLRRMTSDPDGSPWLFLRGRRWRLTPEGQRVRGVVTDLIHRYAEMGRFVASGREGKSVVSLACGQQAAGGFVRSAVTRFLKEHPDHGVRIATPRGKARIEGVAGGQFDLAVVTDTPATIRQIARREMFIETLFDDRFVLAGLSSSKTAWGKRWGALPTDRPIHASELSEMPFIVPEADSQRRRQFDEWCQRTTGKMFNIIVEAGGWQTILEFAEAGIGIGLVTASALEGYRHHGRTRIVSRPLDEKEFPPDAVRLVTRKGFGRDEPELTEPANELRKLLRLVAGSHADSASNVDESIP